MVTQEETLTQTPETDETERWLGPIKVHGGSDTIIRKAARTRTKAERLKQADDVHAKLAEASTARKDSLRLRLYDELIVPEVLPVMRDLQGMVAMQKEEA